MFVSSHTDAPNLQQGRMNVRNDVWQSPPFSDGQTAGHLHQPLDEVELLFLRVTDGEVATMHVHLPGHFLWTAQLHLMQTGNTAISAYTS